MSKSGCKAAEGGKVKAVIRKIIIWIVSIWFMILTVVHDKLGLTWRLAFYDMRTGFRDNRAYLTNVFLPVTAAVIFFCVVFVLILEHKLVMHWEIRIKEYKFSFGEFRFFRKYQNLLTMAVVTAAVGLLAVVSYGYMTKNGEKTWSGTLTIAHAGGIIDEYAYSNCLDAVLLNYEKGQRAFELDFAVTSDNKLVCKHDWDYVIQEGGVPGEVWDEQRFMSTPIFGQYTPLSFETLCRLMAEYPDIWIVTDTKDTETEDVQRDFEIMVNTARECGMESVLDRIIVQIYNEEMYDAVHEVYPFKSYIYTLYQFFDGDAETFLECVRFCYANDIDTITTWNYFVTPELIQIAEEYDILYYAHTENDVENAKSMIGQGLTGVYTDSITPDMLKEE